MKRLRSWRILDWVGSVWLGVAVSGCSAPSPDVSWIPEDAAVLRCTLSGRDRMPPLLHDIPAPELPTGLYARAFDPMALDDLGFRRNRIVCASLEAPSVSELDEGRAAIPLLQEAQTRAARAARRVAGPCSCEVARALGVGDIVASCIGVPTRFSCVIDDAQLQAMSEALQPVVQELSRRRIPLMHWRVVGETDRPGGFGERASDLIQRHAGGSTVYLRGQAVPSRGPHVLLRALLAADGVQAVVTQNSGRALLVVRELDHLLVFDHFRHADLAAPMRALLPHLDNAHVEDYIAALRKPGRTRAPMLDPREGNLVELDRLALERVDRLSLGPARPSSLGRTRTSEVRSKQESSADAAAGLDDDVGLAVTPRPAIDRIAWQVSFGTQGRELRGVIVLSEAGHQWARGLPAGVLSPTLSELGLAAVEPPPMRPHADGVMAGTPVESLLTYGLPGFVDFVRRVEMQQPSTIRGTVERAAFEFQGVAWTGDVGTWNGFQRLRDRMEAEPWVLRTEFDASRRQLSVVFEPR